jgi:PadR family transcriptional regulator PadR
MGGLRIDGQTMLAFELLSIQPPFVLSSSRLSFLLTIKMKMGYPLMIKRRTVMGQKPGDMVQGTLEMLILKTLALEPMHGYGVALRIEQVSQGVFRVNPGSLLPALARMERAGHVKSEWRSTENNRRAKYYLLTARGRKALKEETSAWDRQTAAISRILEA